MSFFYTDVREWSGRLLVRGHSRAGKRVHERVNFEPYCFVRTSVREPTSYTDIHGSPLKRMDFSSIRAARDFIRSREGAAGGDVYGMTNWPYLYIYEVSGGERIEYEESLIRIGFIDIEVMAKNEFPDPRDANAPVVSLVLRHAGISHAFGLKQYNGAASDVRYYECDSEAELLSKFLMLWRDLDLDVVSGWHIELFDMPYLYNRISRVLGQDLADKLSPWGIVREKLHSDGGQYFDFFGLFVADFLPIYKKFSFSNLDSYKLQNVAEEELKDSKLSFGEHKSFRALYDNDFTKFIDYNDQDARLVERLEDTLGFISLILARAYLSKVNYPDTLGTVRPWDALIHDYLASRGVVIPPQTEHELTKKLIGGHVKEASRGLHEWVVGFDLRSQYPHVIRQWNVSPETKAGRESPILRVEDSIARYVSGAVPEDPGPNTCTAANGTRYRTDVEGFLAALMRQLYESRQEFQGKLKLVKREIEDLGDSQERNRQRSRYHNLQRALKDTLNSGYGALANIYNRWFDFDMAESITSTGQLVIRTAIATVNRLMNRTLETEGVDYVVAADTDSVYVNMGDVHKRFLSHLSRDEQVAGVRGFARDVVAKAFKNALDELAKRMRCQKNLMVMNMETLSDRAIWKATKHYILNLVEDDGILLHEPKLKMKGIEAIKSSTPKIVREAIKSALKIVMRGTQDQLQTFTDEFWTKFSTSPFEEVAFPRSVSGMRKYGTESTVYKKGTPIQVKGALLYNYLLKKHGIDGEYPLVHDSDKIRFCYLKTPNPIQSNVLACTHNLPAEFGMDEYLDRETQFDKAYLEPLRTVTESIGWRLQSSDEIDVESALFG